MRTPWEGCSPTPIAFPFRNGSREDSRPTSEVRCPIIPWWPASADSPATASFGTGASASGLTRPICSSPTRSTPRWVRLPPTDFNLGGNRQQEISLNLDVSYAVSDRLNLAGGAEWRDEQYETRLGQPESWTIGPYAAQGFSVGSNGFSGYSPLAAGKWNRSNVAAYGDIELSGPAKRWTIGTAGRIENFEDFGTTVNGKLSGRYRLLDSLFAARQCQHWISRPRRRASRMGSTCRRSSTPR